MSLYDKRREKASREKLKLVIEELMAEEAAGLEEEFSRMEPHIFSDRFERKMEEVMGIERRKTLRLDAVRYMAAGFVTLALTLGIILIGNEEVQASKPGIGILAWLEDFFVVEEKFQSDKAVLFEESQIGYLPEGFEKVEEEITYSRVGFKYCNEGGDYIFIQVSSDMTAQYVDNEEIEQNICLNKAGYEYRYMYKEDSGENVMSWKDSAGIYYYLIATVEKEELIKIMNGISY